MLPRTPDAAVFSHTNVNTHTHTHVYNTLATHTNSHTITFTYKNTHIILHVDKLVSSGVNQEL